MIFIILIFYDKIPLVKLKELLFMEIYKLKAFILILIIYLLALLPTIFIFSRKKFCNSKKSFLKALSFCTIIQIVIFSLIYVFPRNLVHLFGVSQNVENYSVYALKILFIGSIFTTIHYAFPIYLFRQEKKKKALILFSLKLIYIPVLVIMNFIFSTQTALFTMPLLDLFYSFLLFFILCQT